MVINMSSASLLIIALTLVQLSHGILSPSWRQTFALSSLAAEGAQFEEEPEIDAGLSGDITDTLPSTAGQSFNRKNLRDPSKNDWSKLMNGYGSFECHKIPSNMSLCTNIGYDKMILPNYLQHEEISEVVQQSDVWLNLVKTECNLDLTKFLCSLYAPVCIEGHEDNLILPCRSLCESVKADCLPKMLKFGFSWPDIVNCSRFPELANGMCIPKSQKKKEIQCVGCQESEDIVKEYCKSDFAIRSRIGNVQRHEIPSESDNQTQISFWALLLGGRALKGDISERFIHVKVDCFCDSMNQLFFGDGQQKKLGRWLIMGKFEDGPNQTKTFKATFMLPLSYYSFSTRAIMRKIHNHREGVCTNPRLLENSFDNDQNNFNRRIGRNRRRNRTGRYRRNNYLQQQMPHRFGPQYDRGSLYRARRRHLGDASIYH